jgi:hypothetical protein
MKEIFPFKICCVLRDLDPGFQMILTQYANDVQVTEVLMTCFIVSFCI